MHALIIEDHPVIAMTIADELRECGYGTADIATGQSEAIRMATERCPDVITVDEGLDQGSGIDAIRQICRHIAIPVIFVTANPSMIRAAVPDAIVLEKPFSHQGMCDAILDAVKVARVYA